MSALQGRTSPEGMRRINKIIKLQMQYPRWLRSTVKKVLDEEILRPIHSRMKDFGYSQEIIKKTEIKGIKITDDGELEYERGAGTGRKIILGCLCG